jgi:hypothetical protein
MDPRWLDEVLRIPAVVVFAGEAIGPSHPPQSESYKQVEADVRKTLDDRLGKIDAGFGFSAGAAGSELIFLEAVAARNGQTSIVLPYPEEHFIRTHVAVDPAGRWVERFNEVVAHASEVVVGSAVPFTRADALFEYASLLMLGLGAIQSRAIDTDLVLMAVCDEGDPTSETSAVVRCWRRTGHTVDVIPRPATDV